MISLKGNEYIVTSNPNVYYTVLTGTAIVYLVPLSEDGSPGRRFYLLEINESSSFRNIPSLSMHFDSLCTWIFLISPIGATSIIESPYKNEESILQLKNEFAGLLSIAKQENVEEVDNEIYEYVQRTIVAEDVSMVKDAQQREKSKQELFQSVFNTFQHKVSQEIQTKNPLYEALKVISKNIGIKLISYEKVVDRFGKQFTLEEVSRVSNFMIREITLEEDWYKNSCENLLLYKDRGVMCNPGACIPIKNNHYVEYEFHGDQCDTRVVERKIAGQYMKSGYAIHKAFPERSLNTLDLIRFVLEQLHGREIIKYILLSLLCTVITLCVPFMNQLLYDYYLVMGDQNEFIRLGVVLFSIAVANFLFTIVRNLLCFRIENEVENSITHALIHRLFHMPAGEYQKYSSADLVKRV